MTNKAVNRLTDSPLFPFMGEFTMKALGEPMAHELVRDGENGRPCHSCGHDERILWSNDRWQIAALQRSINPVGLFLETKGHHDFEHFDESTAAEFGVLTWRIEEAIRQVEAVGRVHIHRWGDGSSHFHVWFQGRPARQLELYGWGNVLWPQVLAPLPAELIIANHAKVLGHLVSTSGGQLHKH